MKSRGKQLSIILIVTFTLIGVSGWVAGWVSAYSPDYYYQVQKNIEVFGRVYQEISKKYVEEIDPEKFMKAGIKGMLSTLDPYTVLVEKEDTQELQIMSSGKYGGLGMRIGIRGGIPTVVEPPFDGTPAIKAGIREGDEIRLIDGAETEGLGISKVAALLRGKIGSEVFLEVKRAGEANIIQFRLIRAEIVVTDVVYSGLLKDGVGLIRLSHFSRNAGKDIQHAIRKLKKEGLEALILDLRSNPGGLLDAAISVSENFLDKGKLIVSTKGRANGSVQKYFSEKKPVLEDLPLVVLVNGYSASASEIVSGAIQDHDRGIIIGTRTFGKGLVQTVIPISGEAALKITTAKYLVPSGRSIQDPLRFLKDPDGILYNANDKATAETKTEEISFQTENGRTVYAEHGITPDIVIKPDTLSQYEIELLRKTMLFQFAVIYAAHHPDLPEGFEVTDEMIEEFKEFLKEKEFAYKSPAEQALKQIEEIAAKEVYIASISSSLAEIQEIIALQKENAFAASKTFIQEELKQEISAKIWGSKTEFEANFQIDPGVQKSLELLQDRAAYDKVLKFKE